jgi:hypothetical protein
VTPQAIPLFGLLAIISASSACADAKRPEWTASAELRLEVGATTMTVSWPEARDDDVVSAYLVTIDGVEHGPLEPDTRSFHVSGLAECTDYLLEVVAVDAAGNRSAPLFVREETLDDTPPRFAESASAKMVVLARKGSGDLAVDLEWSAATDSVGVAGYRIFGDGEVVATVDAGPPIRFRRPNTPVTAVLTIPSGGASSHIVAFDVAGNVSTRALAVPMGPALARFAELERAQRQPRRLSRRAPPAPRGDRGSGP